MFSWRSMSPLITTALCRQSIWPSDWRVRPTLTSRHYYAHTSACTRRRYISDSARAHLAAVANDTALAVFKQHMNIARDSTLHAASSADGGTRKHQQLICTLDTIILTLGRYLPMMDKCGVLNVRQWQKNLLHASTFTGRQCARTGRDGFGVC